MYGGNKYEDLLFFNPLFRFFFFLVHHKIIVSLPISSLILPRFVHEKRVLKKTKLFTLFTTNDPPVF